MHDEIFIEEQRRQLPLLKAFSESFGLVGGTAIALHLGHRRSIDFDLFSEKPFANIRLRKRISDIVPIEKELWNKKGQYTVLLRGVKWTFFQYPYQIPYDIVFNDLIKMPDLLTLAAMKAYALGQRAKWKDYVDLFFILRDHYSFQEIVSQTIKIFGTVFNEKLFRTQLAYFEDIDYREPIEYLPGFKIPDEEVERWLQKFSLTK